MPDAIDSLSNMFTDDAKVFRERIEQVIIELDFTISAIEEYVCYYYINQCRYSNTPERP